MYATQYSLPTITQSMRCTRLTVPRAHCSQEPTRRCLPPILGLLAPQAIPSPSPSLSAPCQPMAPAVSHPLASHAGPCYPASTLAGHWAAAE